MTVLIYVVAAAVIFAAGKLYGASAEKAAVSIALAAFAEAKAALASVVTRAQVEAKAEVDRLEALAKRYL